MAEELLTVFAGIAIVLLLSEIIIRHSIELAAHFRLSGTFIGLTALSVGTSLPEIFTNVLGSIHILHHPQTMHTISGLVIGTNVGSDIFQLNFVLPIVGLIGTIVVVRQQLFTELGAMVGATLLLWIFGLGGTISRLEGLVLITAYASYFLFLARSNHLILHISAHSNHRRRRVLLSSLLIVTCFLVMAVVAYQVLGAATILVAQLPLSASFFGVIVLGIAGALPELTTALASIVKGQREISAGILIGSNITNPLLGIGLGATISRYAVPDVVVYYDLPVKIFTAVILYIFLLRHEDLSRTEAITLILLFCAYVYIRNILFPEDFPSG